jgi:hypothetical protein
MKEGFLGIMSETGIYFDHEERDRGIHPMELSVMTGRYCEELRSSRVTGQMAGSMMNAAMSAVGSARARIALLAFAFCTKSAILHFRSYALGLNIIP